MNRWSSLRSCKAYLLYAVDTERVQKLFSSTDIKTLSCAHVAEDFAGKYCSECGVKFRVGKCTVFETNLPFQWNVQDDQVWVTSFEYKKQKDIEVDSLAERTAFILGDDDEYLDLEEITEKVSAIEKLGLEGDLYMHYEDD